MGEFDLKYEPFAGFLEQLKKEANEKITLQQDLTRKVFREGVYYGGFLLPKDDLFAEALPICEWSVGKRYHDNARVILLLPSPVYGAIIMYRISESEYCLKVYTCSTYEKCFDSWDEMKNFCFAWGLLQPPYTNEYPFEFAERLKEMDKAMKSEVPEIYKADENLVLDDVNES